MIFGAKVRSIGHVEIAKGINIFGAIITHLQLVIVFISLLLFVLLFLFMKKTKLGRNMKAVSDNKELASIIGINYKKISDYSFILGSGLAGVAGILIGLEQNLYPTMGTMLMVKGFTGAVIGGVTFVPGAIIGSYLLGLVENLGILYLPSGYKDAIAFALLFIFLLVRPAGLFGIQKGVNK
jgi:branched-chain amino acid transport system permease protein